MGETQNYNKHGQAHVLQNGIYLMAAIDPAIAILVHFYSMSFPILMLFNDFVNYATKTEVQTCK